MVTDSQQSSCPEKFKRIVLIFLVDHLARPVCLKFLPSSLGDSPPGLARILNTIGLRY